MKPITKLRFDLLAGYSRTPILPILFEELFWCEEANEKLLGLITRDRTDNDFLYTVLGRDALNRFRALIVQPSVKTFGEAVSELEKILREMAQLPPGEFHQGDDAGFSLDFFSPIIPSERQNPSFKHLINNVQFSSARAVLGELMHYYKDIDGNFVEQFQSSGFDHRIWELYLFATFTELEYGFKHEHVAPDFHLYGPLGEFFLEATTVNPTDPAPEIDETKMDDYINHYVAIKYGSALFSKLNKRHKGKRYWELDHVSGYPFTLAIQDFHAPQSMSWTNPVLLEYLYGIRQDERVQMEGAMEIQNEKIEQYVWGDKVIPAGFFYLQDAENVSAIIANPTGTLSKFNRMGYLAGFGKRMSSFKRVGFCYTPDEYKASIYSLDINAADYTETWLEGLSVYHNPIAKIPLPFEMIPGAAHYSYHDGKIFCRLPDFHPFTNTTLSAP